MPVYPDNPAFEGFLPLQLRRGSLDRTQNYVPAEGELIYSTTTYQVFVGDGSTVGGWPVSGQGGGDLDFGSIIAPSGFSLDLGSIA